MAFRTILIHANDEIRFEQVLEAARLLATRSQAEVTALAILPAPYVIAAGAPGHPDVVTIDTHRTIAMKSAAAMRARLEEDGRQHGYATEWRLEDNSEFVERYPNRASIALAAASTADLVIVEQFETSWTGLRPASIAEHLLIASGRPIVLIPKRRRAPIAMDRVLIAWNASKTAARAVSDAMPLLRASRYVKIVHFTSTDHQPAGDLGSAARLAKTLARHDIHAEAEELPLPVTEPGAAILSAVKAINADILVMGCYGHARLQEFIFGGSTRHVLQHMTVPVLMAH